MEVTANDELSHEDFKSVCDGIKVSLNVVLKK